MRKEKTEPAGVLMAPGREQLVFEAYGARDPKVRPAVVWLSTGRGRMVQDSGGCATEAGHCAKLERESCLPAPGAPGTVSG